MEPKGWLLNEEGLRDWLRRLGDEGRSIVAPVEEEEGLCVYRLVTSVDDVSLAPGKTRWSPKEYLFPRSEPLYSYTYRAGNVDVKDPAIDDTEQVLFGLRACDAAGVARLDAVFLSGEVDPFYAGRRARTTVVTMACQEAEPGCFCTAVGGSPAAEDGSDLMVVPLGESLLVYATSAKGEELVEADAGRWDSATTEDWQRAELQRLSVEESMGEEALDPAWASALEGAFDDPVWERWGEHCLGCSVCAYVCPTCTCFDVGLDGDAWSGVQSRCWDSCTFAMFTHHATGHNPRPDQATRYRQRLLHKFAYTSDGDQGGFRCVGCGRCIALCPAGIDIHRAVREVAAVASEGVSDVGG